MINVTGRATGLAESGLSYLTTAHHAQVTPATIAQLPRKALKLLAAAILAVRSGIGTKVWGCFGGYVNGSSTTWAVHLEIRDMEPGNPVRKKFIELRDLMIEKGAKWPPDSPVEVREQMRARGETPVVPRGHTR